MPPGGAAGAGFSSFSTTTHSVVRGRPAMDAAFCSAMRVPLVGSMTPAFTRGRALGDPRQRCSRHTWVRSLEERPPEGGRAKSNLAG